MGLKLSEPTPVLIPPWDVPNQRPTSAKPTRTGDFDHDERDFDPAGLLHADEVETDENPDDGQRQHRPKR
ncbi:hypothetical protein A4G99_22640 [Haladaptatus sp. R4]|nr:hypothetical protein A4G99_22640 [Haladaptatus sp. R4]